MRKIISILAAILIHSVITSAQEPATKAGKLVEMLPADLGYCGMFLLREARAVFNDQQTLNKAVSDMKAYCVNAFAPEIDFDKFTLIGASATVGNCPAGKFMGVRIERDAEKKVYLVTVTRGDNPCRGLSRRQMWFLIPKVPADYTIKFESQTVERENLKLKGR